MTELERELLDTLTANRAKLANFIDTKARLAGMLSDVEATIAHFEDTVANLLGKLGYDPLKGLSAVAEESAWVNKSDAMQQTVSDSLQPELVEATPAPQGIPLPVPGT